MKGRDLQKSVTITFEEAAFGTKKQIKLNKYVSCDTCGGSGAEPGTSKTTCPECNGTGQVNTHQRTPFGVFQSSSPSSLLEMSLPYTFAFPTVLLSESVRVTVTEPFACSGTGLSNVSSSC